MNLFYKPETRYYKIDHQDAMERLHPPARGRRPMACPCGSYEMAARDYTASLAATTARRAQADPERQTIRSTLVYRVSVLILYDL